MPLLTPEQNSSSSSSSEENVKKPTIFERIKCLYARDIDFNIIIKKSYDKTFDSSLVLDELKLDPIFRENSGNKEIELSNKSVLIWEKKKEENNIFCGIITESFLYDKTDSWFINLAISTARVDFPNSEMQMDAANLTRVITDEFVRQLKKTGKKDEWDSKGKYLFEKQVNFFVSRGLTIEAVLPAFPCKSSNPRKVASWEPDKGEELALTKIINFAITIKDIYPPGILLWIVSDGHVFSDCIGVDDIVVDQYSLELQKLYSKLKPNDFNPVRFSSMKDIFCLHEFTDNITDLLDFQVEHHLNTKIDPISEISRKLLIASCDTDSGKLKEDINTANHPRLHLFRGFSKFMSEDLILHPAAKNLSRKKYKKIVSKIAFEMIKRNDAYSNLIEVVFPSHLRFSIHAHTNSGPKFGINLMDSEECKVIRSLELHEEPNFDIFEDLLHIPTPWHNCVLRLEGSKHYFVTVIDVINQAISTGTHECIWNKEEKYFLLSKSTI